MTTTVTTTLNEEEALEERADTPDGMLAASEGESLEASGGAPEAPKDPPVAKRRPRRVRALTLDD